MAEIRIRAVPAYKVKEIKNIAASFGMPISTFLKMELGKLIDAYPEEKKKWLETNELINHPEKSGG